MDRACLPRPCRWPGVRPVRAGLLVLTPALIAGSASLATSRPALAAGSVGTVSAVVDPAPGVVGTSAKIAASSTGSSSPVYRYRVASPGGSWTTACNWTASPSCTFTPGKAGTWSVVVEGRDASGKKVAQASSGSQAYTVTTATSSSTPDFSLSLSSTALTLPVGGSASTTVTVTRSGGFTGDVVVTASQLGSDLSAVPVVVPAGNSWATLTITAAGSALSGVRSVSVDGSGGGLVRSRAVSVGVDAAPLPAKSTVAFSGYTWNVKGGWWGPGPNNFSTGAGVSVDAEGRLHLKVLYQGGKWYSSEVWLPTSLGYGVYEWVAASRPDLVDRNLVAAPFLYQDDTHELDFEFTTWQNATTTNCQYVVQPHNVTGNLHRFSLAGAETSTWRMTWTPDGILFQTLVGGAVVHAWDYQGLDNFAPGGERVHINFWQIAGTPPSDKLEKEFVFQSFQFTPWSPVADAGPRPGRWARAKTHVELPVRRADGRPGV